MSNPQHPWHVLGAGAQGLLWLAYAERAQLGWQLLLRAGGAAPLPTQFIYEQRGERTSLPLRAQTLDTAGPIDKVLVCVKTYQLASALRALQPHLNDDAIVVLALNGYGWQSTAAELLPRTQLFCLSSTHGSYRPAPLHVVDTGVGGRFVLGSAVRSRDSDTGQALVAQLLQTGLALSWSAHIDPLLLRKLAVNACINPLTAHLHCRNGELLAHAGAQVMLPALVQEVCAALPLLGLSLTGAELWTALHTVCAATAGNFSSMHEDYWQGRETEVEAILSPLISAAQHAGCSSPTLNQLRDFIRAGLVGRDRHQP